MQTVHTTQHLGLEVQGHYASRLAEIRDTSLDRLERSHPQTVGAFVGDLALTSIELSRRAGVFASAVLHGAVHVEHVAA